MLQHNWRQVTIQLHPKWHINSTELNFIFYLYLMCFCSCVNCAACICIDQRLASGIFFNHFPKYLLRKSLVKPRIHQFQIVYLARLLQGLCLSSARITGSHHTCPAFFPHCRTEDLNSKHFTPAHQLHSHWAISPGP